MSYVAAGAAVFTAGAGIYKSIKAKKAEQKDRAKLEELEASKPKYPVLGEFEQNLNLQAGNLGMGDSAKNFYQSVAEQGLTAGIGATQQAGGGVNSLGELLDKHNQSMERAAQMDAQMKIAGIGDVVGANSARAGQKLIQQFGVPNEQWRNDLASTNRNVMMDQQTFNAGLSDVTSSVGALISSGALGDIGADIKQRRTNRLNKIRMGNGTPIAGYTPTTPEITV